MIGLVLLATAAGGVVSHDRHICRLFSAAPLGEGNGARGIISWEQGFVNRNLKILRTWARAAEAGEWRGFVVSLAERYPLAPISPP